LQGPMSQINFPLDTKDYRVVRQSSSSNISIINGVKSQTNKKTYSIKAKHSGVITIPALQMALDGQTHTTEPVTITVKKSATQTKIPAKTADGVFIKSSVSKTNPYVNQQILYTVKTYHTGNLKQISNLILDSDDFLIERINEGKEYRETIGATRYFVYEINYNLFPVSAGYHTLPAFEIEAITLRRRRNSAGMPMFLSPFAYEERHKITSNPINLNVRSFPTNTSKHFAGYIGELVFKHELERKEIKEGEAISLNLDFYGDGNPNNISYDVVEESDQYEIFVDKPSIKTVYEDNLKVFGISNRVAIVAQKSGKIAIKIKPVTVYNPQIGKYETLPGHKYLINVKANPELKKLKAKQRKESHYKAELPKVLMTVPVEQILAHKTFRIRALWMLVSFLIINFIALALNFSKIQLGLPKLKGSKFKLSKALKELDSEDNIIGISTKVKDIVKNLNLKEENEAINRFIEKTDRLNYGLSPQSNIDITAIKQEAHKLLKDLKN